MTAISARRSTRAAVFFTWRAGAAAAGVALLWLLSGYGALFQWAAVGANLLLLALVLVDLEVTAGSDALAVERRHDRRLSLGTPNTIRLEAASRSSVALALQLRDAPPLEMEPNPAPFAVALPPRGSRTIDYEITPTERGEYRFGDVWVRREGRLGLIARQWAIPMEETVEVYPNVLETRRYEALLVRGRLHELGLRSARSLGAGREFAALRDYQPDDEFRAIDWNATARRVKLIVRQYEIERSRQVMVVLDCGRLMSAPVPLMEAGGGSVRPSEPAPLPAAAHASPPTAAQVSRPAAARAPLRMTKLDFAVNAALVFAYVALALGDRVGVMTFAEEAGRFLPPMHGPHALERILDELYAVRATAMDSSFSDAYLQLQGRLRKRSLLLFFTDLMDPETARSAVRYLGMLTRRHLCLCVAVGDPEVAAWASGVPADEEGIYRQAVAVATLQDRSLALAELRRSGVHAIDTLPQTLTAEAVNRYLEVKTAGLL